MKQFNYDRIKRNVVYGKVYAHKGDECNELARYIYSH